jgi:phosphoribosyl-AMP cyclohydrolase
LFTIGTILRTRGGRCSNRTYTGIERTPASGSWRAFLFSDMHLDFAKSDGLITAVIQDHRSGRVLMVGYMNEEAFRNTVETGYATFYSRSRRKLWLKGETSGHRLVVKHIATDCDQDAVLVQVEALGPGVCHEGYQSCFFRSLDEGAWKITDERAYDPSGVYGGKP